MKELVKKYRKVETLDFRKLLFFEGSRGHGLVWEKRLERKSQRTDSEVDSRAGDTKKDVKLVQF